MKLCVLTKKLASKPLYSEDSLYLYYLPIKEYKKHLLKGNVQLDEDICAYICHEYSTRQRIP